MNRSPSMSRAAAPAAPGDASGRRRRGAPGSKSGNEPQSFHEPGSGAGSTTSHGQPANACRTPVSTTGAWSTSRRWRRRRRCRSSPRCWRVAGRRSPTCTASNAGPTGRLSESAGGQRIGSRRASPFPVACRWDTASRAVAGVERPGDLPTAGGRRPAPGATSCPRRTGARSIACRDRTTALPIAKPGAPGIAERPIGGGQRQSQLPAPGAPGPGRLPAGIGQRPSQLPSPAPRESPNAPLAEDNVRRNCRLHP